MLVILGLGFRDYGFVLGLGLGFALGLRVLGFLLNVLGLGF